MNWQKLGRIFCPDGTMPWARHSFMTPVPVLMSDDVIRLYGGMRDDDGISRIGWIDVDSRDPTRVLRICNAPALDIGAPGMFDDNGVILGDVIRMPDGGLRMYYVGFQIVKRAKFLAFTGLAISDSDGVRFDRVSTTPVLDRTPTGPFINALHSIMPVEGGFRAWISCGRDWQYFDGQPYPKYDCWTVLSKDGVSFDTDNALPIMGVNEDEYRIGRPRVNHLPDGSYELRVTSDSVSQQYACFLAVSDDGINFIRTTAEELPRGAVDAWDEQETCYPARIDVPGVGSYLFYNGNGMGRTGVGVARWVER